MKNNRKLKLKISNKYLIIGLCLIMILLIFVIFSIVSGRKTAIQRKKIENLSIPPVELIEPAEAYVEELEGYDPNIVKQDIRMFYGKWKTTSDHSEYLFGHIEVDIKKDGTWTGFSALEPMDGTWTKTKNGIYCTSEFVNFSLGFTDTGALLYQEENKGVAVLTKEN